MPYKKLILFIFLLINTQAEAQTDKERSDSSLSGYLDDGKAKNSNSLIQFRIAPALSGFLGLSFEQKFSRRISLEIGYFYSLGSKGYFQKERLNDKNKTIEKNLLEYNKGFGLLFYPKINTGKLFMNNQVYIGLRMVKQYSNVLMNLNFPNSSISYTSQLQHSNFMLMLGYHKNVISNFTIGMDIGGGFCFDNYKKVRVYDTDKGIVTEQDKKFHSYGIFADISIGYLF